MYILKITVPKVSVKAPMLSIKNNLCDFEMSRPLLKSKDNYIPTNEIGFSKTLKRGFKENLRNQINETE